MTISALVLLMVLHKKGVLTTYDLYALGIASSRRKQQIKACTDDVEDVQADFHVCREDWDLFRKHSRVDACHSGLQSLIRHSR